MNVMYPCFSILAEAISCLLKAIEIYTDMGRFTMAAKHHQSIAEIYESEAVDLERAVHHYEQAADYFRGEESNSSANKCLLKVAQYAAQLENYEKAIQIYEQVKIESIYRTCVIASLKYLYLLNYSECGRFEPYQFILQVASASLESSLLKYSAKEYFFRAALCHLCVDSLNAQHALERYQEQYPAFQDAREYKLVKVRF